MAELMSLQQVADHLGVHYMTAYRYIRLGMLPAHKDGAAWRVAVSDLEVFERGDGAGAPATVGRRGAPDGNRWIARFEARVLAGDGTGAWQVLEAAMSSGTDLHDIELEIITPALVSIGERWVRGEIDIADEHLASAVTTRLLSRLSARFVKRGRTRGSVVLGAVAGDHHSLPVMILADLLMAARFEVVDLGADVPAASFVHAGQRAQRVVAMGLSMTAPGLDRSAAAAIAAVREALGDVPVLVGGGAVDDAQHAAALGADGWAPDGRRAVELIERLADTPSTPSS